MLGTKIKQLRELKNYTREFMADKLAMSEQGYSRIERNEVSVNFIRLQQIAEALEMDVTELIDFDSKQVFTNKKNVGETFNVINGINKIEYFSEDVKKLYEDKIKLLEEQNDYLKQENERLKKLV